MNDDHTSLPESVKLPFEQNAHTITPFFSHMSVLSVPDSETKGEPVYDLKEMVQLRFAGDRNYSPVFETTEMWRNINGRVVTYAERFSEQYRAFVMGENQVAGGTALEMLRPYGMTPAQISMCNALKVYSIEAILEMRNPNALGMATNAIMAMAKRWQADHAERQHSETQNSIEAMQAEIDRLKALIPAKEASPAEIETAVQMADDEFSAMSSDELKEFIASKRDGKKPVGNYAHASLVDLAREAAQDAA